MHFLDASRCLRRNEDAAIDLTREPTTAVARKRNGHGAGGFGGAQSADHVFAVARRRNANCDITGSAERLDLPREELLEAEVVADGGQGGRVGR